MPVSEEAVEWAYKLLLGSTPPSQDVINLHRDAYESVDDLRRAFLQTSPANSLFKAANGRAGYSIPLFLLRAPEQEDVRWMFQPPSISNPVCQLCTAEQMETISYRNLCSRLGLDPAGRHRKAWEFVYILAVLQSKGYFVSGACGLGFGTGSEPMPSVFASMAIDVTATDAPSDTWGFQDSRQWATRSSDFYHSELVSAEMFSRHVEYLPVDMNNIPNNLRGYDFCWSACCLEHLGSISNGLEFICNSLETLRPGGVAVHTTELNLL